MGKTDDEKCSDSAGNSDIVVGLQTLAGGPIVVDKATLDIQGGGTLDCNRNERIQECVT